MNYRKKYNLLLIKLSTDIIGIDFWTKKLIPKETLSIELSNKFSDKNIGVLKKYWIEKENAIKNSIELIEVGELLGYTLDKIEYDRKYTYSEQLKRTNLYNESPQKEGRDNKGVYVGSGGSNKNKVRYPSKKRNKKTWKTFYEMFPRLAITDNWDGNTSDKMSKK